MSRTSTAGFARPSAFRAVGFDVRTLSCEPARASPTGRGMLGGVRSRLSCPAVRPNIGKPLLLL